MVSGLRVGLDSFSMKTLFYDISPSYRLLQIAKGIGDWLCFNNAIFIVSLLPFVMAQACELGVWIMGMAPDSQPDVYTRIMLIS